MLESPYKYGLGFGLGEKKMSGLRLSICHVFLEWTQLCCSERSFKLGFQVEFKSQSAANCMPISTCPPPHLLAVWGAVSPSGWLVQALCHWQLQGPACMERRRWGEARTDRRLPGGAPCRDISPLILAPLPLLSLCFVKSVDKFSRKS